MAIGKVQVPASVGHLLEYRLEQAGRPGIGLAAHTPYYLAAVEYPAAAEKLLETVEEMAGLSLSLGPLRVRGAEVREAVDSQLAEDEQAQAVIDDLERRSDLEPESPPLQPRTSRRVTSSAPPSSGSSPTAPVGRTTSRRVSAPVRKYGRPSGGVTPPVAASSVAPIEATIRAPCASSMIHERTMHSPGREAAGFAVECTRPSARSSRTRRPPRAPRAPGAPPAAAASGRSAGARRSRRGSDASRSSSSRVPIVEPSTRELAEEDVRELGAASASPAVAPATTIVPPSLTERIECRQVARPTVSITASTRAGKPRARLERALGAERERPLALLLDAARDPHAQAGGRAELDQRGRDAAARALHEHRLARLRRAPRVNSIR